MEEAKEQEVAERRLKIMEDGRDKLINLADTVQEEAEDRTQEKLIELSNEVLYNKGNVQSMAQMLQGIDNPDILARAQLALDEANKATNNSSAWITGLCKRQESLHTDSEAGIIIGGQPHPRGTGRSDPGMNPHQKKWARTRETRMSNHKGISDGDLRTGSDNARTAVTIAGLPTGQPSTGDFFFGS